MSGQSNQSSLFRSLGRRHVASAAFLHLERLHLTTPDGGGVVRVVVRHPGAVSIVPVLDDDTVILIRQYRAAVGHDVLEVPAGKLDVPGEPPVETAARELQEELGYVAGSMTPLTRFYTSPGFCDEEMFVFVASDLTAVPASPHGVEEEVAEVVAVPIRDLPELLASTEIEDAKTIAALGLYLATRT